MQDQKVTAYEGAESYIFISYAHKDTGKVFPILEQLQEKGYRIWYDDGIAPGSEWPENIAQHLNDCAMTMAFISPNSMASPNCRREINFALSKQKPFLSVVLEPTEMPLGMELQLSAQQSVIRYNYRTNAKFIEKICSCPDLQCCQEIPVQPEPEQAEPEAPADLQQEPKAPRKPLLPPKQEKPKAPKPVKEKKPRKPGKVKKILGIIAGVIALIVIGSVVLSAASKFEIAPDMKVDKNDTSLYLRDLDITADTMASINKMKKLENLTFTNCRFQAGALDKWKPVGPIDYFSISGCTGISTLSFLADMPALRNLNISGSGITDAMLPALNQEKLNQVELSGNPGLTDLSKLQGLSALAQLDISGTGVTSLVPVATEELYRINFSQTPVSDLSPLAECSGLYEVIGPGSAVTDISPLAGLIDLNLLNFAGCDLSEMDPDITFLCLRLATLNLGNTGITSLKPFENMTRLTSVSVGHNALDNEDLLILGKSSETLKNLDISATQFVCNAQTDTTWLAACTNLTDIAMNDVQAENLNFLSAMENLKSISAYRSGIKDISGLSNCSKLTKILLACNNFTNVDAFANLLATNTDYVRLDLTNCKALTDISCLPPIKYSRLCLAGCPDIDFSNMGGITGNYISLTYFDGIGDSYFNTDPFSWYFITDCPDDQKVALEELLGSFKVEFTDTGRNLIQIMEEEFDMDCSYLRCSGCNGNGTTEDQQTCPLCAGSGLYE